MSFGFSVSDFVTIGRLLMKLSQDYASAPTEGRELANDLKVLQDCIDNLGQSSEHFSPEDNARLAERIAPVRELLEEMEKLREKFSSLAECQPRIWDRLRFPKLQVQAIHKKINLHMSTLNLFMGTRSTTSLINIEGFLKEMAKNNPGGASIGDDENWSRMLLPELQRQGMALDSAERCRTYIEEHLVALSEVEVANSQLLDNFEGSIVPDDALDEEIVVGGPTPEHTFSCLCPGAILLQKGDLSGIKESQSIFYRHFGGHKYELSCKHCKFHGFQDEPFKRKNGQLNTPLLFCARDKALTKSSPEYYLDIHKKKQGVADGIFYHTLFFWKSHVQAKVPEKHDAAMYECVFCPKETAYGSLMGRKQYIDHIRRRHVQKLPSLELRQKFNVYIDNHPALFKDDEGQCEGKKFDILLPRALGRTDIIRAEQAQREAEALRLEEEKKKEEEKRKADEKIAAEEIRKVEEFEKAEARRKANSERSLEAAAQVQQKLLPMMQRRNSRETQLQLKQKRQPKLLGGVQPLSTPRPLPPWHEPPGRDLSPVKSILKNKGEGEKAVRFLLEEPEDEEPEVEMGQEDDEGEEEKEQVLSLVKTTYTPIVNLNRGSGPAPFIPKPKIVEVSSSEGFETLGKALSQRPSERILNFSPEKGKMVINRDLVESDLDSAIDISSA